MADYIYLLQHRLTSTQRRALEAVRDAARGLGAPVFLVGGAVRDLTSGSPVRDLDFAVQGEVSALVEALTGAGAASAGEDSVFLSRYFVFPGGVRVEVGPTLAVSYPTPSVPEVQAAAILDDLRRRDFTANAMAISLNEGSYGLLLDPLNGVADLENRELRLVSNLGFIEQPALLLRAARLSNRLGWTLEERTQRRYENAKEEGATERLSAEARGYEVEEIFHEEDPISAMEYLDAEGWLKELSEALSGLKVERDSLDRVRDTLGQMEQLGIFTDPSPVYFPLLTARLPGEAVEALKRSFARPGFPRQIDTLDGRSRELAAQLTSKASASASAVWKLLFAAEPEVVLALASGTRATAIQSKFKAFFHEWPSARQKIPYALMQEMRITPEIAGYDRLLEDLFFALIDGRLATPEETRAFLEPFSPPAPAQQTAPRRRAAKSARGRGRQAAVAVVAEEDAPETDHDDDETAEAKSSRKIPREAVETPEEDSPEGDGVDEPVKGSPTPSPRGKGKTPEKAAKGVAADTLGKAASEPALAAKATPASKPDSVKKAAAKPGLKDGPAPAAAAPVHAPSAPAAPVSSRPATREPTSGPAAPVKPAPAKKGAASPEKTAGVAAPAVAAKAVPKPPAKKSAVPPAKSAAKKLPGKTGTASGTPAKTVPGKIVATKKTPAKQAVASAKPAKKTAPAKRTR